MGIYKTEKLNLNELFWTYFLYIHTLTTLHITFFQKMPGTDFKSLQIKKLPRIKGELTQEGMLLWLIFMHASSTILEQIQKLTSWQNCKFVLVPSYICPLGKCSHGGRFPDGGSLWLLCYFWNKVRSFSPLIAHPVLGSFFILVRQSESCEPTLDSQTLPTEVFCDLCSLYQGILRDDGMLMAAGSEKGLVKVFDVGKKLMLRQMSGHTGYSTPFHLHS